MLYISSWLWGLIVRFWRSL